MRQSKLFTKTKKEELKEETALNAQLLLRAGFINKEMAGVYSFLPLGLKVLKKVENIIREEMEKTLGAQEVFMPALHPLKSYELTKRDSMDILFYTDLVGGGHLVLGPTHEEVIAPLMKNFIFSYKDLPFGAFQIQSKFRNELRAKAGILRGREFLMKDLYSFHADRECLDEYYEKSKKAYKNIFDKLGIGDITYLTFASGGTFSKYSHEFQMITEAGEDNIYVCEKCNIGINEEIIEEVKECPQCQSNKESFSQKKATEIGNIFVLGDKFSKPFNLTYKDKKGEEKEVLMGCYGIGVSRVVGAIVEAMADEKGMVWPKNIAPFSVHLISIGKDKEAEKVYKNLSEKNIEVLFDDRDKSPGEKFAESDLMGIPLRVVMSEKTLKQDSVEVKERKKDSMELVKIKEIINHVQKNI